MVATVAHAPSNIRSRRGSFFITIAMRNAMGTLLRALRSAGSRLVSLETPEGRIPARARRIGSNNTYLLAGSPKLRIFGPAATATNCRPSTMYVIGEAVMYTLVAKCHSVFPSRSSAAAKAPFGSP